MSADFGLGKEALHGIVGAFVLIVIAVTIGSFIAQGLSHGPKAGHGAAEAPAAEAPAAAAAEAQ